MWDAAGLVAEECWLVLLDGYRHGSLSQNNEGVSFGVKVEDHDVAWWGVRDREKTGLIGQGIYRDERGCGVLQRLAESVYLSRIPFPGLHTIAEHCALGDVETM